MSVRPSAWNNSAPTGRIFMKFDIYAFFEKFSTHLNFIKIGYEKRVRYVKTNVHLWSYLAQFFLEWKMFQTKFVEKIETHILCSMMFFFFLKLVPFVRCGKSIVQLGRPQMIIWRMCIACWVPKATNIYSKYVIFISSPVQHWLHERSSMLCYTYIACLVQHIAEPLNTTNIPLSHADGLLCLQLLTVWSLFFASLFKIFIRLAALCGCATAAAVCMVW